MPGTFSSIAPAGSPRTGAAAARCMQAASASGIQLALSLAVLSFLFAATVLHASGAGPAQRCSVNPTVIAEQ